MLDHQDRDPKLANLDDQLPELSRLLWIEPAAGYRAEEASVRWRAPLPVPPGAADRTAGFRRRMLRALSSRRRQGSPMLGLVPRPPLFLTKATRRATPRSRSSCDSAVRAARFPAPTVPRTASGSGTFAQYRDGRYVTFRAASVLADEGYSSRSGRQDACDHVDHGALTGAIWTDQGMDMPHCSRNETSCAGRTPPKFFDTVSTSSKMRRAR